MKKISLSKSLLTTIVCLSSVDSFAQEAEWNILEGDALKSTFSQGFHLKRSNENGNITEGIYEADGTGVVKSWNGEFPRTWKIKDDKEICVVADKEENCYVMQVSKSNASLLRAKDATSGKYVEFSINSQEIAIKKDSPNAGNRGGAAAASAEEIAKELSNPNTTLGTLNTNFDFTSYDGTLNDASSQSATTVSFQPALPYPIAKGVNAFLRPNIPLIISKPALTENGFEDEKFELGDIGYDLAMGKTFATKSAGAYILIGGMAGVIPTATSDTASGQWSVGPELGLFTMQSWGVLGVIASHQWNVSGEIDTEITGGQYVYVVGLGGGWQFIGSPTFSYDHKARNSSDALTLPVGAGIAKTFILDGRPWKMSVQYWNYIEKPEDFGPQHQLRITIGPVVGLPWGK